MPAVIWNKSVNKNDSYLQYAPLTARNSQTISLVNDQSMTNYGLKTRKNSADAQPLNLTLPTGRLIIMTKELLPPAVLIELMENKRYGVEYQPIIDINSQEPFGYESLARFFDDSNTPIRPDLVYSSLHNSPLSLFQVEYQQKLLQLSNAPVNEAIFVNMDQDSYFSAGIEGNNNPFLTLFDSYKKTDIIVELIENSEINHAIMSLAMIDALAASNIHTAIDDVCNPQSMVSTSVIQLVNFIKLDKHVVSNKHNAMFMCLVNAIINYAHDSGKQVILEGVENQPDLEFARQLNVDYVQGFLYREQFLNVA